MKEKTSQDGMGNRENNSLSGAHRKGRTNQDIKTKTAREVNSPAVKRSQRTEEQVRKAREKQRNMGPHSEYLLGAEGGSGQDSKSK
jgi:hypothetical protein